MTNDGYEYFRRLKTGAEHIAETEAGTDPTPPPHPDSLDFEPAETSPDRWQVPNDPRAFRSRDDARRAGLTARAKAERNWANYQNALIVPAKTPGQEAAEEYESAKAEALSKCVTPDAWENSPEVRAAYLPDSRIGAELWEEYKRNKRIR
ncbi:hypothetical protein BJG92_03474 [Arthrobacter sp. SO5]|uniref:hypothetical protein n=1 Tax=Arthrobacter sp. SO5 TaxID=1897055 RepID=UPI001E39CE49|nr:hypothetical protein [Arthrobacter sp. SO5]MCB5275920.1 hypothetical protein [Arthrobacter sp. SO5]